jgi:hypothetical protein
MSDTDLSDARLREILAEEYEKVGRQDCADDIREGQNCDDERDRAALNAMRRVASRPQQGENTELVRELRKATDNKALPIGEAWELLDRAASALSRAGNGWQPIETAPKDGTWIFVYRPSPYLQDAINVAMWAEWRPGFWYWQDSDEQNRPEDDNPTHWMPLPAAPHPEQE